MSLISAVKEIRSKTPELNTIVVSRVSLDELWYKAEQLGSVEVDKSWSNGDYIVSIMLSVRGSRIYARGEDRVITEALEKAIQEALRFKGA